jgi:hypothetical protein
MSRDNYLDQIRAKVHREFPKRGVKQAIDMLKTAFLDAFACKKAFSAVSLRRGGDSGDPATAGLETGATGSRGG